jgi:chemotaxis protein MotB
VAVKKRESKEPSCPLWLATYGDMVTNMLVFFVLLLSMSEIKKEERFIEFMQAVREAFGYVGGLQALPIDQPLDVKNVDLAQMIIIPTRPENLSESPDPGVRYKHHTVRTIQRGDHFVRGGKFFFDELSHELSAANEALAAEYAEKLRGFRTQIEVRGHCSLFPVDDTGYGDHFGLAMARARAVADALVRHGIAPERIILASAGANEPTVVSAYTPAQRRENDRVEVFQLSKYVEEFGEEASGTGLPTEPEGR